MQGMIYMEKSESEILFCQKKKGFPGGSAGKECASNLGDLGSIRGLRSPGEGEWLLPTAVLWPGEFHELYSPWGCKELDMTE